MVKSGGILSCFNAESGEMLYQEKLGAAGAYFASPVAVNNKIYFASRNGIVFVIEAGDELNILSMNNLHDKIAATPAIVDSKVYLRTANSLYAFGY
jgi:outer membrane protein assembly factor BamB